MSLAKEVFDVIGQRYLSRADDIALCDETEYSFENWCQWEAIIACKRVNGWKVRPKPRYGELGILDCDDEGDLLVTDPNRDLHVLVELGLVHGATGNKWLSKLDKDTEKVGRKFRDNVVALQLILCTSIIHVIETAQVWQSWLAKLRCWSHKTDLCFAAPLPPSGQMVLRGWEHSGSPTCIHSMNPSSVPAATS